MENSKYGYFDLATLMGIENLGMQQFAANSEMTDKEYFEILFEFLRLAPDAENALSKFEARDIDREDYRSLDNIIVVLASIECHEFIPTLYDILGAYEKGNWRLAAHHAKTITGSFSEFTAQIGKAERKGEEEDAESTATPLKEQISLLEKEEGKRKMVVLAVDDSPIILKSVSSLLSDLYKVYTLPKPEMLKEILKKITPELFLLDYLMPEINGFELIPIIRSFEEHKDTPIVFLTSEGTIEVVKEALSLGASDFIIKPFNPDMLREKIATHIVRKLIDKKLAANS